MQSMKFMRKCDICGTEFQFGPHVYSGKYIPKYDLTVCGSCWDFNWDGWNPQAEVIILAHLKSKGLPIPSRNKKGWLPRE